jgi:hypothetical protein
MVTIRQEEGDMLVDEFSLLGLRRFCEGNASHFLECNADNR